MAEPSPVVVRPPGADDVDAIGELAVANEMFAADELDWVGEALDDSADGWAVATVEGAVVGAAHWAPEPFADRVWNLLFIAVRPDAHRRGVGRVLVEHLEGRLRSLGGDEARVLLVETSSTDAYDPARRFYARRAFDEEARIREYYGPGDDKVVFWKRLV